MKLAQKSERLLAEIGSILKFYEEGFGVNASSKNFKNGGMMIFFSKISIKVGGEHTVFHACSVFLYITLYFTQGKFRVNSARNKVNVTVHWYR